MNLRLRKLNKTQNEIEEFFESIKNNFIKGHILRKEIVKAVVHFLDIKLDPTIVNLFISSTEFSRDEEGKTNHGIFDFNLLGRGYTLKKIGINGDLNPKIVPLEIALKASRMMIDKFNEEERIISKTLVKFFEENKNTTIKISLEAIQKNYEDKDARGMLAPLITVTQEILNFIPELSKEKSVCKQIKLLYETKTLNERYKINKDVLWGLNSARIIRNEEAEHHKQNNDGNISMHEAIGYSHLLVLFINSLFTSGEIKFEKIDE